MILGVPGTGLRVGVTCSQPFLYCVITHTCGLLLWVCLSPHSGQSCALWLCQQLVHSLPLVLLPPHHIWHPKLESPRLCGGTSPPSSLCMHGSQAVSFVHCLLPPLPLVRGFIINAGLGWQSQDKFPQTLRCKHTHEAPLPGEVISLQPPRIRLWACWGEVHFASMEKKVGFFPSIFHLGMTPADRHSRKMCFEGREIRLDLWHSR